MEGKNLHDSELKEKLSVAGIDVGSRFRIERMCSFNDMHDEAIDLANGERRSQMSMGLNR